GRTTVIWPHESVPAWARNPAIQGWLFSARTGGSADSTLRDGQWFPGGHFWFRSRVLANDRRFEDTWFTEPAFMLHLIEDGCTAVRGCDAVAAHRIQSQLLDPAMALERAER